jgi:hypothetical protein
MKRYKELPLAGNPDKPRGYPEWEAHGFVFTGTAWGAVWFALESASEVPAEVLDYALGEADWRDPPFIVDQSHGSVRYTLMCWRKVEG